MPFDVNDPDPYHTAQPAQATYPNDASRNNAKGNDLDKEALERFKAQGNTDAFIQASKDGFAKDSKFMYILHRILGSSVDLNPALTGAVCRQNITIACRFTFSGAEMDNEADYGFVFLLEKRSGHWGIVFHTLLFDKDKFVPVNPAKIVHLPEEEIS
ncbi:hypothetical protein MBLNU13_g03005t1 [Cladosporium sp. NU13]